jgi:replicative DNA helicase Mcm
MGTGENDAVPITARQLEAYVRLSEASARMRLSRTVDKVDADRAIKLVEYYLGKILAPDGGQWEIDKIGADYTKKDRGNANAVLDLIDKFGTPEDGISEEELVAHAASEGLGKGSTLGIVDKLMASGTLYKRRDGKYKRA